MTYKPLKNPEDAYLVHLHEEWEVIYWCKKFNCSRDELKQAVDAVGNMPGEVKAYLLWRSASQQKAS
ncbi:MAG: DUF3606 domain-containing protein [Bacteroidia bacterium]|jgi:hypothetical protein|nr:DUF3606 domain-containing protein [Bacteroidia bacterium]